MRTAKWKLLLAVLAVCLLMPAAHALSSGSKTAPRIELDKAKSMLGKADVEFIDVRLKKDYKKAELKVEGAVREHPDKVNEWMKKYPKDKTLIFYCA